jgi:hypothetical protein
MGDPSVATEAASAMDLPGALAAAAAALVALASRIARGLRTTGPV